MKAKVIIADVSAENARELEGLAEKTFDAVVFDEIYLLVDHIKQNGNNTAALIVSAAFLGEYGDVIFKTLKRADPKRMISVVAFGKALELEKLGENKRIDDYITKPFSEMITLRRVTNAVNAHKAKKEAAKRESLRESKVHDCVSSLVEDIVGRRNLHCGEHTQFVQVFTAVIAKDVMKNCPRYGLTREKADLIASASKLHDIGKVAVKDAILFKPERLSDEEYAQMKLHPVIGAELFEKVSALFSKEYADICRDIILYHHERFDGGGYPCGLVGEQIPIAAQIVALADVYDALVSNRVYKRNIDPDKAVEMILDGECGVFSDEMLGCLIRTNKKLAKLSIHNDAISDCPETEA